MGGLPNERISDSHVPQVSGSQLGDHRLSTSCGFVEPPDHRRPDDLVSNGFAIYKPQTLRAIVHVCCFIGDPFYKTRSTPQW